MKAKREIELDGVDLLLWAAVAIMGLAVLVQLLPDLWLGCLWIWKGLWIVIDVRHWPFWIWTCLGVIVLGVLLWLRTRYE